MVRHAHNSPDLNGLVDHQTLPDTLDLGLVSLLPFEHTPLILVAAIDGLRWRLIAPELLELKDKLIEILESDERLAASERVALVRLLV